LTRSLPRATPSRQGLRGTILRGWNSQEICDFDTQYRREPLKKLDTGIGQPPLEPAQISPINARLGSECFCRDIALDPKPPEIPSNQFAAIHALLALLYHIGYKPTVIILHREEPLSGIIWKSVVKLSNGFHQEVRIQADSQSNAKAILEAQYGRHSILSGPWSVHSQ
jgi:hypothetical protein